jgi:hypothetical protein
MTLDQLLRQHADPVLRAAGLRRTGRRYQLMSDRGDVCTLYVDRRPSIEGGTGFDVGIVLLPASQLAWQAWQADVPVAEYRPDRGDGLWRYPLRAPAEVGSTAGSGVWAYRDQPSFARCGEALETMLREHGVPLLLMGQDRRSMLASLEPVLLRFGRLVGTPERTRVLLLIDDGPSAELDAALAAVTDDPDFLAWARARLGRVSA